VRLRHLALVLCGFVGACGSDDEPAGGRPDVVEIAFLRAVPGTSSTEPEMLAELRRAGFVEGGNLTVFASAPDEVYPAEDAAADAVSGWRDAGVDLIVALSSSGAAVAQRAAPDVNILFLSNDPLSTGLVNDEQSPDGRSTGATFRVPADLTLAYAGRAMPGIERIGLAYPPDDPAAVANRDALQSAADAAGITLITATFADTDAVPQAVDELAAQGVQALLLSTSPVATRALPETQAAAEVHSLPVIANSPIADFAMLTLTPDLDELGRQLGRQASRLLSGALPATVPVEDPRDFTLTVNVGAAVAMGVEMPADLLREADLVVP
jgi:putative ABC transport system substrate-binding protein